MSYGKRLAQYKKTNVETAGGIDLIIMCYDKTIQSIKEAIGLYQEKEYEKKAKALQKALDIIHELRCSIDFEKGGEIAGNLLSLYDFMTRTLLQTDVKGNAKGLADVAGLLTDLKEAWESIASGSDSNTGNLPITKTEKAIPSQLAA